MPIKKSKHVARNVITHFPFCWNMTSFLQNPWMLKGRIRDIYNCLNSKLGKLLTAEKEI